MVRQKKITMEEGTLMRTLLFMPGGLELHIGVRPQTPVHNCAPGTPCTIIVAKQV